MKKEEIISLLDTVMDPEIPVLSIAELGILRGVDISGDAVLVTVTPTYSGCPAMDQIQADIRECLLSNGYDRVNISQVLSPAWTTEWISASGREKLEAYGIAAPASDPACAPGADGPRCCPHCHSEHTELISRFGSTPCKALYRCLDCHEPFDYFKCH